MVFKWFDTVEVDAFADATVKMFMERFPPSEFTAAGKKQQERFRKVHAALAREMQDFRKTHSLNIYQKARLANRFKWALKDAAYPDAFIDELAYELAAMTAVRA
ncbi:hypothetical protein [Caenimonas koreensis]|uniref:hypothetical protein n=1 Tax=Caenimonas koreensis TaxID=367474 RepID=UPI003783BDFF